MAFDRVLPRPPALYQEQSRVYGSTGSLLEHKIMNDSVTPYNLPQRLGSNDVQHGHNTLGQELGSPSTNYSPMQISTINRETIARNEIASTSFCPKQIDSRITALSPPQERSLSSSPSSKPDPSTDSAGQFCLCQPDPKVPRPRNVFMLYRQHNHAFVAAQNPGLANPEISKMIGKRWRNLSPEKKDEWKALAEVEKVQHQKKYPDYRYQPRRLGRDGTVKNSKSPGNFIDSSGATICTRCGGRLINPPNSLLTPFKPGEHSSVSRMLQSESESFHLLPSQTTGAGSDKQYTKQMDLEMEEGDSVSRDNADSDYELSTALKRLRAVGQTITKDNPQETMSDMEGYDRSPPKSHIARSGAAGFCSRGNSPTSSFSSRWAEDEKYHKPPLTLPPLQTSPAAPLHPTGIERATPSTPFLDKIRVLAKISPPLSLSVAHQTYASRGAIIAVDGQQPALVNIVLKSLGRLLTKNGNYAVRIFEGPEPHPQTASPSGGDIAEYIGLIALWHRISDEIIQFVSPKAENEDIRMIADSNLDSLRALSPSGGREGSGSSPDYLSDRAMAVDGRDNLANGKRNESSPIPIALVPRYQLTTADAFARAIPIKDRYNQVEHWQWMASLWRACVGPDATVYIRDCTREEIGRYGGGNNPVEVRLSDARTLIIRRSADSPLDIEEKALRRVGFEIEELVTR